MRSWRLRTRSNLDRPAPDIRPIRLTVLEDAATFEPPRPFVPTVEQSHEAMRKAFSRPFPEPSVNPFFEHLRESA